VLDGFHSEIKIHHGGTETQRKRAISAILVELSH
jgi:hypothetical protein